MQIWQLQEAKAHFSRVIKEAVHAPQEITLRGKPVVVVLSMEEYEKLAKPKLSFVEFMRRSPLAQVKIRFHRDRSLTRETDL